MSFDAILDQIIQNEGREYTNDPDDPGGPTKFGITLETLHSWRGKPVTPDDVKNLTEDEARTIYTARYWTQPGFASVDAISPKIAAKLADAGVNVGPGTVSQWLQRTINVMGASLTVDGKLGPASCAALKGFLDQRGENGEAVMLRALNGFQATYYIGLAEKNPTNRKYAYGWILQRCQ